mgnify:CR=1 FL=1
MSFKTTLYFLLLFAITSSQAALLDSLRREHPRIIFTDEVRDRVLSMAQTDELLQQTIEVAKQYAEEQLQEPPIKREFDEPGNPRLKRERRASMFRVFNLGVLYRLTGEQKYADRVKQDLLAAAQFSDWGPNHYLNIGEISMLMGCGFDWIYDTLSEEEKDIIVTGILKNGLDEGIKAYNGTHQDGWWTTRKNNWNQVCNGGLTVAALAVAEYDSATAADILDGALNSVPHAMQGYKPDGAWYEGPTYFAYGTTYNALLIEATRTALGQAIDWQSIEGYDWLGLSGNFHIHTVGPSNLYFNFGDAKTTLYFSPVMFWFSHTYDQPVYAAFERLLIERDLPRMRQGVMMENDTLDRFFGLLIAWYDDRGQNLGYDDLPLDITFAGDAAVGAMRSGWERDDLYLGFKGGYNKSDHGHMDIGSFVLDAGQVRWALDLGGDEYDALPGYFDFDDRRWDYFRCNNNGHNTLVIDDAIQNPNARVSISDFYSNPDSAYARIDMTRAYFTHATKAERTFIMANNRSSVRIEDHLKFRSDQSHVRWGMITAADITLMGAKAVLAQDGKYLAVRLLEPANGEFQILSTKPDDPREDPNTGTRMLATFVESDANKQADIIIELIPTDDPTGVTDDVIAAQPNAFELRQNYPNPFNPRTTISFRIAESQKVNLSIYNAKGQLLRSLVNGFLPAGEHRVVWDGHDNAGQRPAAGVCLYRMQVGNHIKTLKMVLMP